MSFEVGVRVESSAGKGTIAFIGETQFSDGEWIGIILDEPKGKNNGTVQGVEYFQCEPNYGLFTRPSQIKIEGAKKLVGLKAPTVTSTRKDSIMSKSGNSKLSPGSSPGMSPAVSSERLAGRQSGMGPRSLSKLADISDRKKSTTTPQKAKSPAPSNSSSRMLREASNLSQSSVASSRASVSSNKLRQFAAPDPSRRQSIVPPKKLSTAAPAAPKQISKPKQASEDTESDDLPPPTMTNSGTQLQTGSVLSRAKKIDDTAPTAPMSPVATTAAAAAAIQKTVVTGSDNSTELEYLRLQVKDLTEKLENMRAKRKDDHSKLLEFERISIEHRTLQEVKSRLNDRVVELERQLLDERKSAEDLKTWHESNKDTISEHQEMMEMATIEKELAEERADTLQNEVQEMQEKIDAMQVELDVLRNEMASGGSAPVGNSVQMKQIEQQNEKLKDALIKLRDLNAQATVDKQKAVEEAERLKTENAELIRVAETLKRQAELAESKIAGFQEQIDAAMGAEEMVTQLTNKNFDMEEKITKLEDIIDDLEEARDLDEQLAEVQKQQEKDLMKEIEDLKINIHELNGRIRDEQKHAFELSQTILKFRETMANLNSLIQDQKDQILSLEEELHGHRNEDMDRASMVSQLQVSANKNFAEAVERQVNAIELEYTRRQAGYLKAFLPDNFAKIGGEYESILMVVMFPRLSAKAKLLAKLTSDCFPQVPGGMRREHVTKSHKGEQWAHVSRIAYITNSLVAVLGQFESAINETTVEVLKKLTEMYGEMATHERSVDQYLELLKGSRFDENTSLENLEKPLLYFQNAFSIHIGGDGFNGGQWVSAICQALLSGISYCRVNVKRISYFLQESIDSGDVFNLLQSLNDELAACESTVIKSTKHISQDPKKVLKLDPEFTEELLNSLSQLEKIASILKETSSIGAMQIGGISETEGFDDQRIKEMIHGVVVKFNGWIAVENAFEPIRKNMFSLRDSLEKVFSTLESAKMEKAAPEKKNFPPLLDRAHNRKQAASEAEGLRWQMDKKESEMLELRKQIKERIQDISNYKLRLDMAESRLLSTNRAEGDKVNHLEEKINQLMSDHKRKQIEFDESMDALQREMKEIEKENMDLKHNVSRMNRDNLSRNTQSMETRSVVSALNDDSGATRGEVVFLEQQLGKQIDARKRAELEVYKLRGELAQCGSKRFDAVPGLISGPITLESQTRQDQLLKMIDNLHEESLRLRRDEKKHLAYIPSNPKISTEKMLKEMEQFNKNREDFYDRLNSVNRRLRRVWQDAWGENYPFDNQQSQNLVKEKTFEEVCTKWGIVW